jgi:YD repeat-containing protein
MMLGSDVGPPAQSSLVLRILLLVVGRPRAGRRGEEVSAVTFDYAGSVVTFLDEEYHQTRYTYQGFGDPSDRRLAELLDAEGHTTSYGYDAIFGNLATVTAPVAQGDRSFEYVSGSTHCDNGFLWKETHPESGDTTYEHSCLGLVTRRTRAGGEAAPVPGLMMLGGDVGPPV